LGITWSESIFLLHIKDIMIGLKQQLISNMSHFIFLHLVCYRQWKFINKADIPWNLIMGDLSLAVIYNILSLQSLIISKLHPDPNFFTHLLIIHSNAMDVRNALMLQ